jgi:hypothetical protein
MENAKLLNSHSILQRKQKKKHREHEERCVDLQKRPTAKIIFRVVESLLVVRGDVCCIMIINSDNVFISSLVILVQDRNIYIKLREKCE